MLICYSDWIEHQQVAPYCASKWAIEGLTRSVAKELPSGVAIVALSPGVINTDMLVSCFGSSASLYQLPEAWYSSTILSSMCLYLTYSFSVFRNLVHNVPSSSLSILRVRLQIDSVKSSSLFFLPFSSVLFLNVHLAANYIEDEVWRIWSSIDYNENVKYISTQDYALSTAG